MTRAVIAVWLALAALATGQDAPPRLELPKPPAPSIPPPRTTYTPPPPSKWDSPLLYSQIALAGAGTGATTAAAIRRYQDDAKVPAIASVGVVGLVILVERAYAPTWSDRTRKWVSVANFGASGVLAGLMTKDIRGARSTLKTATAPR